jgi:NADPH:quinone reductase-like Zn-dependent oxidoreductase
MLRAGGRLVAYGASSVVINGGRNVPRAVPHALRMVRGFNLIKQVSDSKSVLGLNMLRLWDAAGSLAPWLEPACQLVTAGTLVPVIDEEVPFDRVAYAHRKLGERRNIGKMVLTL